MFEMELRELPVSCVFGYPCGSGGNAGNVLLLHQMDKAEAEGKFAHHMHCIGLIGAKLNEIVALFGTMHCGMPHSIDIPFRVDGRKGQVAHGMKQAQGFIHLSFLPFGRGVVGEVEEHVKNQVIV